MSHDFSANGNFGIWFSHQKMMVMWFLHVNKRVPLHLGSMVCSRAISAAAQRFISNSMLWHILQKTAASGIWILHLALLWFR